MDFGIKYVTDLKITGTFKLTLSFNLLEVYEDMNESTPIKLLYPLFQM